jgi:hypothetical protein
MVARGLSSFFMLKGIEMNPSQPTAIIFSVESSARVVTNVTTALGLRSTTFSCRHLSLVIPYFLSRPTVQSLLPPLISQWRQGKGRHPHTFFRPQTATHQQKTDSDKDDEERFASRSSPLLPSWQQRQLIPTISRQRQFQYR